MSHDIEIYAFSGKIGSGKNYIAENVLNSSLPPKNTVVMALADHFKVDACTKNGVQYERIYHNKDSESRRILQMLGTEQGRNVYGQDIWIKTVLTWIKIYSERGTKRFIITDIRFPNEVKAFKEVNAIIIRVHAPLRNKNKVIAEANNDPDIINTIRTHTSETSLDSCTDFDYTIYNDIGQESSIQSQVDKMIKDIIDRKYDNQFIN